MGSETHPGPGRRVLRATGERPACKALEATAQSLKGTQTLMSRGGRAAHEEGAAGDLAWAKLARLAWRELWRK